jgi:V/A-type H+-transporting ATPase subunit F
MYKMAVMGDKESVLIFKAFGADVYDVAETDTAENRKLMNRLSRKGYILILITDKVAQHLEEDLAYYRKSMTPAILVIPSGEGSIGLAERMMKQNVERAVGVDIVQSDAEINENKRERGETI